MTQYAAYDHSAIYAIGDTPEAAIAKARNDARDDEAIFETAKIGDADALEIEDGGFNGHYDGFDVKDGWIVLSLRRQEEERSYYDDASYRADMIAAGRGRLVR